MPTASLSSDIKRQIALLEKDGSSNKDTNSPTLPPITNNNNNNIDNSDEQKQRPQYIVKFAHIPSEAFYCTATTWRELCIKTQQVWGIDQPYFTFTTVNALDRQVTFRLTCAADFESVWSNPDAPAMQSHRQMQTQLVERESKETFRMSYHDQMKISQAHNTNGGQFFGKQLLAHDHRQHKNVAHSADYYQYAVRPFVSAGLLSYWPVRYCIRHTLNDEVIFVSEKESQSWGYAVQKCQSEWSVLRPLFRYIDDIEGERTIISIVSAEDFQLWFKRRRTLWPELLVFEHAAPSLLIQHKEELLGVSGKYLRSDGGSTTRPTTTGSSNAGGGGGYQNILPQFDGAPEIFPDGSGSNNNNNNNNPESPLENDEAVPVETEKFLRLSAGEKRLMQIKGTSDKRSANKNFFPLSSVSHGVAPLIPDTNRDVSYYPSKTTGFPIANSQIDRSGRTGSASNNNNNNNNNSMMSGSGMSRGSNNYNTNNNSTRMSSSSNRHQQQQFSNEANALLSSFRRESLQTKTEFDKVQEERQYQAVRAKHVRDLERALMASSTMMGSSPLSGRAMESPRSGRRAYL